MQVSHSVFRPSGIVAVALSARDALDQLIEKDGAGLVLEGISKIVGSRCGHRVRAGCPRKKTVISEAIGRREDTTRVARSHQCDEVIALLADLLQVWRQLVELEHF